MVSIVARSKFVAPWQMRDLPIAPPGWSSARPEAHYWLDRRWKQYVRGLDALDLWEPQHPEAPNATGVYFLWSEDLRLLYVGMSIDVLYRATQHTWAGLRMTLPPGGRESMWRLFWRHQLATFIASNETGGYGRITAQHNFAKPARSPVQNVVHPVAEVALAAQDSRAWEGEECVVLGLHFSIITAFRAGARRSAFTSRPSCARPHAARQGRASQASASTVR